MLRALAVLLVCQLVGEIVARGLGLPIPGPVIGLVVLFAALSLAGARGLVANESVDGTEIGRTAAGLLSILGILFVPAGVGVIRHMNLLAEHGLALALALVVSTAATLAVTVWVFRAVARLSSRGKEGV